MHVRRAGGTSHLDVTSDDLAQVVPMLAAVENEIKEESAQTIVVDLAALDSIFSLQIGTLAAMHVACYENLAVLKLASVHPHVRQQLLLVGLDKLMELHHGPAVVKESFGGA